LPARCARRRRLGDAEISIVACAAVAGNADKALGRLDDVASEARQDLGYTLCRVQWTMSHDRIAEATRLVLAASSETMALRIRTNGGASGAGSPASCSISVTSSAYQVVRAAAAGERILSR
jgi:soluble lytic murein transglycosylase